MFDCSKQINSIIDYELNGSEKYHIILFNCLHIVLSCKLVIFLNILLVFISHIHYRVVGDNN